MTKLMPRFPFFILRPAVLISSAKASGVPLELLHCTLTTLNADEPAHLFVRCFFACFSLSVVMDRSKRPA